MSSFSNKMKVVTAPEAFPLKTFRVKKNLKQSDLSKIMNVTRETIGSWEKGATSPYVTSLVLLINHGYDDEEVKALASDMVSWYRTHNG